ncbi:hypothetical protein ACHAQD_012108 [Fusarium lateritium]
MCTNDTTSGTGENITTTGANSPEASQAFDAASVSGISSGGAELTKDASAIGVPTNPPGQPNGDAIGTKTSVFNDGDATKLLGTGSSTDIVASLLCIPLVRRSSLADGVAATATAINRPAETSVLGGNIETTADGAVPTKKSLGTAPGTASPGEPSGDVTAQTEDFAETMGTVKPTEGQIQNILTDTDGLPTVSNPQNTAADFPEQTPISMVQSQDNSLNETTLMDSDSTSAAEAEPTTVGVPPTNPATKGDDATTKPADDTSDISSVEVSSSNDGPSSAIGVTTSDATAITNGGNTPSTTTSNVNGPFITLSPAPVTTTAAGATAFPTITDVPESLAPEWTSNTWITTTSGNSSEPTIVPILVCCKKCSGSGSVIILWDFPKATDTCFKLPGLPKFTVPCIPPGCTTRLLNNLHRHTHSMQRH